MIRRNRNNSAIVTIDTHCPVIGTNGKSASIDVIKPIDADLRFYCPIDPSSE